MSDSTEACFDDDERRARLGLRHLLAPSARATGPCEVAEHLVALHATDPVGVVLSTWARQRGFVVGDLEAALYVDRTLVRHLAMRRAQFLFPRARLAAAHAACSRAVGRLERRELVRDVERAGLHDDGERWLAAACDEALAVLADGRPRSAAELRDEVPALRGATAHGEGRSWAGTRAVGGRVLLVLWCEGRVARAANAGPWTTSRPTWTTTEAWLGGPLEDLPEAEARAELVRGWLARFGPGTVADLRWWLGSTVGAVRQALADVRAVAVRLGEGTGYVLADDVAPVPRPEPWAALLPALDPTIMGWRERDWYLGPHRADLFDTAGNAGPSAWWDGRVVGGWSQAEGGEVRVHLLEDVGAEARARLAERAAELSAWLGGRRVLPRYPSPLARRLAGDG